MAECQETPCSKQAQYLEFKSVQQDSLLETGAIPGI